MYDTLTQEQLDVFQAIGPLMGDVFFVDGPGGSGKTYLYTFLIHYSKSHNVKVMSSAMTAMIAAILLPDGQTAHRTFSSPVPCLDNCRISPSSLYAEQLRQTTLFYRRSIYALQTSIRSHRSFVERHRRERCSFWREDCPSRWRLSTNFICCPKGLRHRYRRQTLPVVPRASDTAIVDKLYLLSQGPQTPLSSTNFTCCSNGLRHRYRRKLHHFFFSMECR